MPDLARWSSSDPLAESMTRFSPYNFSFNNPLRYVDPDGRRPNDWFWDASKSAYIFDQSLTSEAQFNHLQQLGLVTGHYIGKGGTRKVMIGTEEIGKVHLFSDGSWTNMTDINNLVYHPFDGPVEQRTQYFTNYPDSSRNWGVQVFGEPWSISAAAELTVGVGGSVEVGYFNGNYDSGFYFNLSGGFGLNAGAGLNYSTYNVNPMAGPLVINPEGKNSMKGDYYNGQVGLTVAFIKTIGYSESWGGNLNNVPGAGFRNYGDNYITRTHSGAYGIPTGIRSPIGASIQYGTTFVLSNSKN